MMFIETHVCGKWQTSIELQSSKEKQIGRIKDKEDKRENKRAFMNYNLLRKENHRYGAYHSYNLMITEHK